MTVRIINARFGTVEETGIIEYVFQNSTFEYVFSLIRPHKQKEMHSKAKRTGIVVTAVFFHSAR